MLPEGYGTSHQENPYFSREMPKPPEPRHHTATHYGAVPGFISSGHASDAGSHRASDAGSGNEGKMPFGRGGATVHGDAVLATRKKPYKSLGWSLIAVRAAPPRSTPFRFFLAAGRGPRPRRVADPRRPEYPPDERSRALTSRSVPHSSQAAASGILIACMVAAAVIPYATVGPDHDVSTDTENLMHEHMAFSFDSRASKGKGNRVAPNDEVAALAESDEPRVVTVSLEDALKTDVEVDSYKVTAPIDDARAASLDDQYRRESSRDPNAAVAAVKPRVAPTLGSERHHFHRKASSSKRSHHRREESAREEKIEQPPRSSYKMPMLDWPREVNFNGEAMLAAEAERTGTIPDGWPSKLVVVPAVYNEWDMPEGAAVVDVVPEWARPTYGKNKYTIGPLYQRRFESKPNFVPNHSYETGVFLKFIIDNYDQLPDVTAFVQADFGSVVDDATERLDAIEANAEKVTYQPLGVDLAKDSKLGDEGAEGPIANPKPQMNYVERSPAELVQRWKDLQWGWDELIHDEKMGGSVGHLSRCWRHIAQQFVPTKTADSGDSVTEEEELKKTPVTVATYPGLNFAMSREQIKSVPREKWRMVYDSLVIKGECVPRPAGEPRDDIRDKFDLAVTLEHFPHVVFGGKQLDDKDAGRCCGEECVLRDAACDAIAAARKSEKKHSKHSKHSSRKGDDDAELGHKSRKSHKNAVTSEHAKATADFIQQQFDADAMRFKAHMTEVASKLARYNGWDVELLTAVKQPPAEAEKAKAAALGAAPVSQDPIPELNSRKVTVAKAAAKATTAEPVQTLKPVTAVKEPVQTPKPMAAVKESVKTAKKPKTAKEDPEKPVDWDVVTEQAHKYEETERANRIREAAANQELIDKSMFDAAFAAADKEVETAEKELKKDADRIKELEKRLAEAEAKAAQAEKAEKKYMKKYNKAEKEAKAAAEFEDKFSARAAFPAAELAKAEGNEGAAAAREARIEARRQERITERQVARAAARV